MAVLELNKDNFDQTIESNDIVYPAGPHDTALVSKEERVAAGIGEGMGSYVETDEEEDDEKNDFDWMDFRLKFGCQEKVCYVCAYMMCSFLI